MASNISTLLLSLNSDLERVILSLKEEEINRKLHEELHNHDKGALPNQELSNLADKSIDLLHEIQQMLEPGHLTLADHFLGYVPAKCLVGAVNLGIADKLNEAGPMTASDLAVACGARPDRLHQVLRVLASNGIFSYNSSTKLFWNNHASTMITKDHWTQWNQWVTLYGNQFYDMARGIPESLRKDATRTPAQINYDTDLEVNTFFKRQGWFPQVHRALNAGADAQAPGILADYPWSEVANETVIDIGGGGGAFLALLLREHKSMRGGIFELPHVIEHIKPFFHSTDGQYADLAVRVPEENLVAGNFFEQIPRSTVYTIKWTLHNWKDEDATRILRNIRNSLVPGANSRLIVLDSILDTTYSSRLARHGDMNMMIAADGLERTMDEWTSLAHRSGWMINKVYPLRNAWPCGIDMRPKP